MQNTKEMVKVFLKRDDSVIRSGLNSTGEMVCFSKKHPGGTFRHQAITNYILLIARLFSLQEIMTQKKRLQVHLAKILVGHQSAVILPHHRKTTIHQNRESILFILKKPWNSSRVRGHRNSLRYFRNTSTAPYLSYIQLRFGLFVPEIPSEIVAERSSADKCGVGG